MTHYAYVLVRKDIPIADQIVQVGHACLEAGRKFPYFDDTHMAVLEVADRERLIQALERLDLIGVRYALFDEPDDNMGFTAACTESTPPRPELRRYQLWKT